MQSANASEAWERAEGIVRHVDCLAREVGVEVGGTVLVFDVPPACTILLNGRPVRLRLLLPRDRVEVDYSRASAPQIAHCIRVIGSPRAQGGALPGDLPGPTGPPVIISAD